MFLRCAFIANGPGPSEAIIEVKSEDGVEELIVDLDILDDGKVDVGSAIAKRDGSYLVELPREAISGKRRVWVAGEVVVKEPVAA